jgi:hypothetical protein
MSPSLNNTKTYNRKQIQGAQIAGIRFSRALQGYRCSPLWEGTPSFVAEYGKACWAVRYALLDGTVSLATGYGKVCPRVRHPLPEGTVSAYGEPSTVKMTAFAGYFRLMVLLARRRDVRRSARLSGGTVTSCCRVRYFFGGEYGICRRRSLGWSCRRVRYHADEQLHRKRGFFGKFFPPPCFDRSRKSVTDKGERLSDGTVSAAPEGALKAPVFVGENVSPGGASARSGARRYFRGFRSVGRVRYAWGPGAQAVA